jgi:aminocarboxymuconate-semialdehyde decarboxylase
VIDLDVHAHLAPVNPRALQGIDGVQWSARDNTLLVDGHRVGIKALFEPPQLITWMDQHSVRKALVSIPPPLYRQHLARDAAASWVRYLNTELLAICAGSHGRLEALFYLPLEHPGLLPELLQDYSIGTFAGVALAAGGHPEVEYWREHYAPVWEWMNARDAFVFIHPGTCQDCRLASFYMENLVGNPYETGIAAAHLIMAGVPSRFPQIRFCLAHAGGTFPGLVGRLQRGFETSRPGVNLSVEHPLQAARRFYADGIAHHPSALKLAQDVLGVDRILFGSDWPFPMGLTQAPR